MNNLFTIVSRRQVIQKGASVVTMLSLLLSASVGFIGTANAAVSESCSSITLTSGVSTTQTAGYTETNPSATPLSVAAYAHVFGPSVLPPNNIPPWLDPGTNANFSTSSSVWVSSGATFPTATSSNEGSPANDQWRLFHGQYVVPSNATVTSAEIWYSADNAAALYQNGSFIANTGGTSSDDVFGATPTGTPAVYENVFHNLLTATAGTNTIDFVVRSWAGDASSTNPTGLIYKAVVNYCVPIPAATVNITIRKFVDGALATASTSNSLEFPMSSTWHLENVGTSTEQYALSPGGSNGNPTPYQAITTNMEVGSDYTTSELTNGNAVGASCEAGKTFAFAGYTTGDTFDQAATGTPTSTIPIFKNLQNNKYVIVWNYTCPPPVATTTTGSVYVAKVVSGGAASSSQFLIHLKKDGGEATGSPQLGTVTWTMYNNLIPGSYVLSETGGPSGYTPSFNGDCDVSGNVSVVASTTKNCIITNTFATSTPTSTPTSVKVHIIKYLDGVVANASSSSGYLFPVAATSASPNINAGATTTSTFTLGNNSGGSANLYGADSASLESPAYYTAAEVTGSSSNVLPIGAQCAIGKYRLLGYSTSPNGFAAAATATVLTTAPVFSALTSDQYLVVWNEKCATTPPPPPAGTAKEQKQAVLDQLIQLQSGTAVGSFDRRWINLAIADLRASLRQNLWVNGSQLNDRRGDKVFDREQATVIDLLKIMQSPKSNIDDSTLQDLIDKLVAIDRLLAQTAIDQAVAAGGNQSKIDSANEAIDKGDAAAISGTNDLGAMIWFQHAWGFAVTSH